MKTKKRLLLAVVVCVLSFAFVSNTFAYSVTFSNKKIYGGTPQIVMNSIPPSGPNLTVKIMAGTQFNNESNICFRAYEEDIYGVSARRSALIKFFTSDWSPGQTKSAAYINGGATASALDTRGSIPNTNATAYAVFYGKITM